MPTPRARHADPPDNPNPSSHKADPAHTLTRGSGEPEITLGCACLARACTEGPALRRWVGVFCLASWDVEPGHLLFAHVFSGGTTPGLAGWDKHNAASVCVEHLGPRGHVYERLCPMAVAADDQWHSSTPKDVSNSFVPH